VVGSVGVCTFVPAGFDPSDECVAGDCVTGEGCSLHFAIPTTLALKRL